MLSPVLTSFKHVGVTSDLVPFYTVVQHWLLAIDRDCIAVGLSLSLHPDSHTERYGAFPRSQYQSIHVSSDLPTPTLLHLEASPPSESHIRLSPGLERAEGIFKPSLEPYTCRMGPDEGRGASGGFGASGISVALSTLAAQAAEPPRLGSIENPFQEGGNNSGGEVLLPKLAQPLAVWHNSSHTTWIREFLEKLLSSSCHLGGRSLSNCMIPSVTSESAGVLSGVLISF